MLFDVTVNWLAILVAAVISFILGWLWFGPLFGKIWVRLNSVKVDGSMSMKGMAMPMLLNLIGNILAAYALAALISLTQNMGDLVAGMKLAVLVWFGFIVCTTILSSTLWDRKPWGLFFFNAAYWLVYLLVMAITLYWIG